MKKRGIEMKEKEDREHKKKEPHTLNYKSGVAYYVKILRGL